MRDNEGCSGRFWNQIYVSTTLPPHADRRHRIWRIGRMAPIGATNDVRLSLRDVFSDDPVFEDCWGILERQRDKFRSDCHEVEDKILGNAQLKAISLLAPSSLSEYIKLAAAPGRNGTSGWSRWSHELENGFTSNGSNIYKIIVDVHQFKSHAHGLSVKTSNQEKNVIIIEGAHEQIKEGHGTIARKFTRKLVLPFDVKENEVQAHLSADGVLLIVAPLKLNGITIHKRELMTVDGRKLEESEVDLTKLDSKKITSGLRNGHWSLKHERELMTVDGRKLDETDVDLSRLDSKKILNGNGNGTARDSHAHAHITNWDAKIQTLPDFDMVPFWCRNYSPHHQERAGLGIQKDSDNLNVLVDVKPFLPEEISVRCTDQFVIVEGNQELKQDPFGFLSRHFIRKYELPSGVKPEGMSCKLTSGILHIKAPKPKPKPKPVDNSGYGTKIPIVMREPSQGAWKSQSQQVPERPRVTTNQMVYVPPKKDAPAKSTEVPRTYSNGNGNAPALKAIENGGRQSPQRQVNGDAHSERMIIPFVMADGTKALMLAV